MKKTFLYEQSLAWVREAVNGNNSSVVRPDSRLKSVTCARLHAAIQSVCWPARKILIRDQVDAFQRLCTLIHVCARFTSSRVSLSLTLLHVEQLRMSYDEICRRKLFSTHNGIYQFRQFYPWWCSLTKRIIVWNVVTKNKIERNNQTSNQSRFHQWVHQSLVDFKFLNICSLNGIIFVSDKKIWKYLK